VAEDTAGDEKAHQAHDHERSESSEHYGGERISGRRLRALRTLLQELVFLVLHFVDGPSNVVHELFPAFRLNHGQGGFESLLLTQVDGFLELCQFCGNEGLQGVDTSLLVGVVHRELPNVPQIGIDALNGRGVRLQEALGSGEEVTPLTRLGILHRGDHTFELGENRVAVRDLLTRVDEPVRAPVRDRPDNDQNRHRHHEAHPDLPSDGPVHLAALLGCVSYRSNRPPR
jgi:hypothetical protein